MKFLIMTRLPEIYSSQRLVQELQLGGHSVLCINPETPWGEEAETGQLVVIPRVGNFRYAEAMKNFEDMHKSYPAAKILNAPPVFQLARHKLQAHKALVGLPQPLHFKEPITFPLIVKDCVSSKGEGVFLCENKSELDECLYKLQGREVLFQEYVAESAGHDVRALIVGKRIVAAMERRAKAGAKEFRANLSLGGTASQASLTKEEENLCLLAVDRLQLDYAGVDFIRSKRGPLLLEINPCPGFEGIEKCTQVNIAREIMRYAESL